MYFAPTQMLEKRIAFPKETLAKRLQLDLNVCPIGMLWNEGLHHQKFKPGDTAV
jgi:hypothetical protein